MGMFDSLKGERTGERRRAFEERYDPEKHGPLVEIPDLPNVVETRDVRPPYARAVVREDPSTEERLYDVFEPELSEEEEEKKDYLRELLLSTVDFDLERFRQDGKVAYLRDMIGDLNLQYEVDLGPKAREKVTYFLLRDLQGYGKVDPLMRDGEIEDISCDGPGLPVFIYHRKHGPLKTNVTYESEGEIQSAVVKLAQKAGKHISVADPLVDATLPEGDRLQLSFGGEVTTRGSTFTIRKFRSVPFSPAELVDLGTVSPEILAYLWLAVDAEKSVLFGGGTASGKTTTLNAICLFVPPESKVVSIEDTRELNIPHENWIPGLTRGGFGGGAGEIDMYDLLESAVRQRPDYLLVGEIRGKEAYVLFQAMATGHITLSTIHAESTDGIFRRLQNPPMNVSLSLLESLDIATVQASTRVEGERVRRILQVAELVEVDYDAGRGHMEDVFTYDARRDDFTFHGSPRVFDEVAERWSLSKEELEREFEDRKERIENAVAEGLMDYRDFWKEVLRYRRESEPPWGGE